MTDVHTPCMDAPDDWFIDKDGRQYVDDEILTEVEKRAIIDEILAESDDGDWADRADAAIALEERVRLNENLVRRRHAKDACYTTCYFRTQCLSLALGPDGPNHGTWGGYHQEELRQIRRLRDERAAARAVPDGE